MNKSLKFITRTAIMLAITVVFQMLRYVFPPPLNSIFVIGSLVNLALVVTAGMVGVWGGGIVSVLAPIIAFLQGHLPLVFMIPVIAVGNFIIVVFYALIHKRSKVVAVISGSFSKFIFLFAAVQVVLSLVELKAPMVKVLSFNYSWPQLVTALIGGFLAAAVLGPLRKALGD